MKNILILFCFLFCVGLSAQTTKIDGGGGPGPGGINTFAGLSDTPGDFTAGIGFVPAINAGQTALEFLQIPVTGVDDVANGLNITLGSGLLGVAFNFPELSNVATPNNNGDQIPIYDIDGVTHGYVTPVQLFNQASFTHLADTPASLSGNSLQGVRVNAGETALEFYTTPVVDDTAFGVSWDGNTDAATKNAIYDELSLAENFINKSWTYKSRDAANGENFIAGGYNYSSTDANLTQASTTQVLGTTNSAEGAHAFVVAGAAGTTDGSDLVLTVTGTSITEGGVRTGADSEVIVADATAASTDQYFETTKFWIGQITYTLSSTGGTTFSFDFNYGFAKYSDFGNRDFTITDFEITGLGNANDSSVDFELLKHETTGWTYAATGFVAGTAAVCSMDTDYSTESEIKNNEPFAYKRSGLSTTIEGSGSEGLIIRITNSVNNSINYLNANVIVSPGI